MPRLLALVAAAVAALHVLLLSGLTPPWISPVGPVDDDYIVWSYARTWLEQGTFAFTPTSPEVEGFSSPLWFVACAVMLALGVTPEAGTAWFGAASFAICAAIVARTCADRAEMKPAALLALTFAVHPAIGWHAASGLGTVPMAACVAIGVGAWVVRDSRLADWVGAFAFALAVGFRLEALLAAVPLAWVATPHGRALRRVMLPFVTAAAVTTWRWATFGEFVPATYFVKALPLVHELDYGARYLVRNALEGGLAVLLFLAIVGVGRGRDASALAVASLFTLAHVLLVGGDWMVYGRFLVPFAPLAFVALATRGRLALTTAILVCGASLAGYQAHAQARFEARFFEAWWGDVGRALSARVEPGRSIATSPIGAIGWYARRPIVDTLGLTTDAFRDVAPDLERVGVKGHHRHDGAWVLDQNPDYLLLGNAVLQPQTNTLDVNPWEADLVADPRFRQRYVAHEIVIVRGDGVAQTLPYFHRRDAPALGE